MITLFTFVLFHCYKLPFTVLKSNRVHWEQHLLQFFSAKFRALATHKLFQRFFLTFSKLCFFPFGGWLQGFLVTLRVRRINHLYRLILPTNSTESRIFQEILPKYFRWGVWMELIKFGSWIFYPYLPRPISAYIRIKGSGGISVPLMYLGFGLG